MAAEGGSSPPPYYADLGKKANDVFGKGYHFGVFKLDLKTKSESGVEFTSGITSNQESGKVRKSYIIVYIIHPFFNLLIQEKEVSLDKIIIITLPRASI